MTATTNIFALLDQMFTSGNEHEVTRVALTRAHLEACGLGHLGTGHPKTKVQEAADQLGYTLVQTYPKLTDVFVDKVMMSTVKGVDHIQFIVNVSTTA